jgi:RNA polymerase sigma factor (sigma-70 family)
MCINMAPVRALCVSGACRPAEREGEFMTAAGNRSLAPLAGALAQQLAPADGELLDRFLRRRDEAAFALLVRRHGPMVLAVCRRALGNTADAEDAFQAAFLALVRKAGALAARPTVGDWLHGVARRVAAKARAAAARRRDKEYVAARDEAGPAAERNDWLPWLDEEVGLLPAKFRLPVVLCDLEGRTRAEAARELGWPEGTVAGYLARGRALLARRLLRRAAACGGALTAGGVPVGEASAVPARLLEATGKTAATGTAPPTVLALASEATRSLTESTAALALGVLTLLTGGLLAAGVLTDAAGPAPPAGDAPDRRVVAPGPRAKPRTPPGYVSGVRFSPDGWRYVVVAGGTVSVHDSETHEVAFTAAGEAAAYTSDGKSLLVLGEKVRQLDPDTGKVVKEFPRREAKPAWKAVALSPDGTRYATYDGQDHHVYDTATGKEPFRLGGKALVAGLSPAHGAAAFFAADGARVFGLPCHLERLTGAGVGVWGAVTGKILDVVGGGEPFEALTAAAVDPAGERLAVGYKDLVEEWYVGAGEAKKNPVRTFRAGGRVTAVAFSKDGKLLAAGVRTQVLEDREGPPAKVVGSRTEVLLFDAATAAELRRFGGFEGGGKPTALPVTALAFAPDGKSLLAGTGDHPADPAPEDGPKAGEVKAFDPAAPPDPAPPGAGKPAAPEWAEKKVLHDPGVLVSAVAYCPTPRAAATIGANGADLPAGGETFATVGSNGVVNFWDRATLTKLKDSIWLPGTGPASLAYSPDGKSLAAGDSAGVVQYDVGSGKKVWAYAQGLMKQPAFAVAFSPDGKSLAEADGFAHVVHSLATKESVESAGPARVPEGVPEVPPAGIAWSPDGTLFARILNTPPNVEPGIAKWRVRVAGGPAGYKDMAGHDKLVTAIAWSKDGRVFASGDAGGVMVLWDGKTFKELHRTTLRAGGRAAVHAMAFAPDGKSLAVAVEALDGGKDGIRVVLLDPGTRKETHELTHPWTVPVVSLAWSRAGSTLVTACGLRPGDDRKLTAGQKKDGGEVVVWEWK